MKFQKGHNPWNKGKTAQKDPRVLSGGRIGNWRGGARPYLTKIAYRVWEEYWHEKVPKGFHLHHVDRNRRNNNIWNLALLTNSVHTSIHLHEMWKKKKTQQQINYGELWDYMAIPLKTRIKKYRKTKGSKPNQGYNQKENHPLWGKHRNPETKTKISNKMKGRKLSSAHKMNIGKAVEGKKRLGCREKEIKVGLFDYMMLPVKRGGK